MLTTNCISYWDKSLVLRILVVFSSELGANIQLTWPGLVMAVLTHPWNQRHPDILKLIASPIVD
jgi:hypothetical protein